MQVNTRLGSRQGDARRLSLRRTLSAAIQGQAALWKGAGPVLVVTALLIVVREFSSGGLALFAGLMGAVAGLASFGALTRIGVFGAEQARTEGLGRGGFQFTRLELRLLCALLLIGLFMSMILSLLGITALALFGAAGLDAEAIRDRNWSQVGPAWKLALLGGIGLIVLITPFVLLVRVSLFAQATAVRGRMIALGATSLTNGAMLPLLAGLGGLALPAIVGFTILATWEAGADYAGLVLAILFTVFQMPMMAGFLGEAWKRLGRDEG